MSSITQTLHEKVGLLEFEDLKRFVRVPEADTLMSLQERCQTACSRTRKAWQADNEREMIQALTTSQEAHPEIPLATQLTEAQTRCVAQSMELDALKQQAESQLTKQKELAERTAGQAIEIEDLKQQVGAQSTQQKVTQAKLAGSALFGRGLLVLIIISVLLNFGQISRPGLLRSLLEPDFPKGSEQGEECQTREYAAKLEDLIDTLKSRIAFQDTQVKTAQKREAALAKVFEEAEQSYQSTANQEIDTLKKLNQSQTLQLSDTQVKLEAEIEKGSGTSTIDSWKKQVELEAQQLSDTQAKLAQVLKSYLTISMLENRLQQWRITTDPPTSSQESLHDYSIEQSRAACKKYGNYSGTDTELVLLMRGPVVEESGVYIGQWNTRNEKHGYGQFFWQSGDCYEGFWRNGFRTGTGRYIWVNGDVYKGDFVQNKREGYGIQHYGDGDEYAGAWVNDKRHGVGSYKYGETSQLVGDQYIGEYLLGTSNGLGAYFGRDGRMYVGSLKSGKPHGKGLMGYPNLKMYFGNFEDGLSSTTGCSLSNWFWIYLLSLSIGSWAVVLLFGDKGPPGAICTGCLICVPVVLLAFGVSYVTASHNQDFSPSWFMTGLGAFGAFAALGTLVAQFVERLSIAWGKEREWASSLKLVFFGMTISVMSTAMMLSLTTITEYAKL